MTAQEVLKLVQKNASSISGLATSNDKIDKVISLINGKSSSSSLGGIASMAGSLLGKGNALSALSGSSASSTIVTILSQLKGTNLSSFNINNYAKLLGSGSNASALKSVLTQIVNLVK